MQRRKCFIIVLLLSLMWSQIVNACDNVQPATIAVFARHHIPESQSPSYSLSWILLSLAAQQVCMQLHPKPMPWTAAVGKVRNGEVDLVFGAIKTAEREKWAIFGTPLGNTETLLLVTEDSPITSWQDVDVDSMVLAATRHSAHWELAGKLGFKNRYHMIPSPATLTMMRRGRIDLLMSSSGVTYDICRQEEMNEQPCLRQIRSFMLASRNHVITSKKNNNAKALIVDLNRGLRALYENPSLLSGISLSAEQRDVYESWRDAMRELFQGQS